MRRIIAALALTLVVTSGLTACGSKASSANNNTGTTGGTSTSATVGGCPSTAQKSFVKTRFVVNVGLIVGTTKHFIYTPYKAGSFGKGVHGRLAAIAKAALAAAAVAKFTDNAIKDVKADPLLCKVLIQPLTDAKNALSGIKTKLLGGNLSAVENLNTTMGSVTGAAKSQGLSVVEGLIPGL